MHYSIKKLYKILCNYEPGDDEELNKIVSEFKAKIGYRLRQQQGKAFQSLIKTATSSISGGRDYSYLFSNIKFKKRKGLNEAGEYETTNQSKVKFRYNQTGEEYTAAGSEPQREAFSKFYAESLAKTGRADTPSELRRVIMVLENKITRIANKHFSGKPLTEDEKQFVKDYAVFLMKSPSGKGSRTGDPAAGINWYSAKSSGILAFKYEGKERIGTPTETGALSVRMIRGKDIYVFPFFPYTEYVLLRKVTSHVGRYGWSNGLWKYGSPGGKYLIKSHKKPAGKYRGNANKEYYNYIKNGRHVPGTPQHGGKRKGAGRKKKG